MYRGEHAQLNNITIAGDKARSIFAFYSVCRSRGEIQILYYYNYPKYTIYICATFYSVIKRKWRILNVYDLLIIISIYVIIVYYSRCQKSCRVFLKKYSNTYILNTFISYIQKHFVMGYFRTKLYGLNQKIRIWTKFCNYKQHSEF